MKKLFSSLRTGWEECQEFLDEKGLGSANREFSRLQRFAHFWLMVAKSFSRNRCPARASALAYTTLLAMIPMIFVAVSVSSSVLRNQGDERITRLIEKVVSNVMPSAALDSPVTVTNRDDTVAVPEGGEVHVESTHRLIVDKIKESVQNIQSGTLGVTGMVLLVFAAISMLSRVEETFNDIWGVVQGRTWLARIEKYWAVVTLGPVLLVVALGLASGPHLQWTKVFINRMPFVGTLIFQFVPVLVLCLAFALFYMLMPNTKVQRRAALAGGLVGGILWHLNNVFSVLYVSRVVTNSKIYGSLGMVPVLMIGLYFSWLILLFGAQVAYAFQNRKAYLQEKQIETINQRGREFVALRLMECVGQRFQRGYPPITVPEISEQLAVPTRLVQQIMQVLIAARLVVEVAGKETAYSPARPLETMTCHDILLALRAGQGQELATRDEPARAEVYGEFQRILEAERQAAASVTMLAMVNRTQAPACLGGGETKAVTDSPPAQT